MDSENEYGRVNRESLWWVLMMYEVSGEVVNCISQIQVNSVHREKVQETKVS